MRLLALCVALAVGPTHGAVLGHAVTSDGRTINLHDTACEIPMADKQMRAHVEMLGNSGALLFSGCWAPHDSLPAFEIWWGDGDKSLIPRRVFKIGPKPGGT